MTDWAGCPWQEFTPGTIEFCEKRLCAWVAEPANTWSSLAFVAVGILVALRARRMRNSHLLPAAVFCVLVGLGSVAFHGTGTFAGEVMDEGSMFMASVMMIAFNLQRLLKWGRVPAQLFFAGGVALSLAALICFHGVGRDLFGVEMVAALGIEFGIFLRLKKETKDDAGVPDYRPLGLMCGCFLVAYAFWTLDYRHILCNPDNHLFGGHAAWHILNATSFYFGIGFYEQFEILKKPA